MRTSLGKTSATTRQTHRLQRAVCRSRLRDQLVDLQREQRTLTHSRTPLHCHPHQPSVHIQLHTSTRTRTSLAPHPFTDRAVIGLVEPHTDRCYFMFISYRFRPPSIHPHPSSCPQHRPQYVSRIRICIIVYYSSNSLLVRPVPANLFNPSIAFVSVHYRFCRKS